MDEVYEEIKEAGNYVVDGVEKTLTDAANYVEDVVAPAPPVARTLDPAHPAPPPPPDEFEQRDGLGLSRDDVLKAPAAAEADKRWDYKKMYARRVVVQCPVLAVALYVAVAQFYDVEARLALARSLDLGWAFSPGASSTSRGSPWPSMPPRAGLGLGVRPDQMSTASRTRTSTRSPT